MTVTMDETTTRSPSSRLAASIISDRDHAPDETQTSVVPVGPLLPDDQCSADAHDPRVVGKPLAPGHSSHDAPAAFAGGDPLPSTTQHATPVVEASAASPSDPGHLECDTQEPAAGADLDGDHPATASHPQGVAVNPFAEFTLGMAAASLGDIERTRISLGLRLGAMEREGISATPEHATLSAIHDGMVAVEHQATLNLQRALRKHPLGPWVKATVGIGEKQGARLIAAIGDPYIRAASYDDDGNETCPRRPRRGPAELWAYCGYAPEQKRRKGVKSNWNADAKMRAFLVAESCIKQVGSTGDAIVIADSKATTRHRSPYRDVYDAERVKWAGRNTTDGHRHNHALRVVAKAVLRDLFLTAKEMA